MSLPSLRALLIEDDSAFAFLMKEFLISSTRYVFDIVSVGSLGLAKERLKNERFDIALVDLGLPDSSGLETVRGVNETAPYLPLIILSGNTDESIPFESAAQGAQDYLPKGTFDATTLTRAIHYAIERKKIERFKEDFSSLVSFELRAPLSVIKGAVDGIRDGSLGPLNDKQKQFMDLAGKHVRRLNKIISCILDLARYESGKAALKMRSFSLGAAINDALDSLRDDTDLSRNVSIAVAVPENLPEVVSDPELVTELLAHLLDNARRFAKTSVRLGVSLSDSSGEPKEIILSVEDDGPGIPPEKINSVFNKFIASEKQATASRRDSLGAGLGLNLCKTISLLLGGKIRAESPGGDGLLIQTTLPLGKKPSADL